MDTRRMRATRRGSLAAAIVLLVAGSAAAQKTDIVYFTNGDRVTCEIKSLQRGKLTVKSIGFGTIHIEWDKVAGIESSHRFQLELRSGIRYVGTLGRGPEDFKVEVTGVSGTNRLDHVRIVSMEQIDKGFFQRVEGSVDVGYEFTQASTATSWNANAEIRFRGDKQESKANVSSLIKTQEGADSVDRQSLSYTFTRFFRDRWFGLGIVTGEQNANQSLLFRALFGAAAGRRLYQTDRTRFSAIGGFAFSREQFEDTDFLNNSELITGVLYDTYKFNSPEIQITADFMFLQGLSNGDRFRLQANATARLELVKDLFWSVSLFESFDRQPPNELARRNDFGLTTSFGWSF